MPAVRSVQRSWPGPGEAEGSSGRVKAGDGEGACRMAAPVCLVRGLFCFLVTGSQHYRPECVGIVLSWLPEGLPHGLLLSLKVEDFFSGWVRGQDEKRVEASSVTEMTAFKEYNG